MLAFFDHLINSGQIHVHISSCTSQPSQCVSMEFLSLGGPAPIKTQREQVKADLGPKEGLPHTNNSAPTNQAGGTGSRGTRELNKSGSFKKVTPWGTHDVQEGQGSPTIAQQIESALDKVGNKIKGTFSSTPRGPGSPKNFADRISSSFKSLSPRSGSSSGSPTAAFKNFANKYFGNSGQGFGASNPTDYFNRALSPMRRCCGASIPVAA